MRAAAESGRAPGPEGSIAKLLGSKLVTRAASLGTAIAGARATAWRPGDDEAASTVKAFVHAPSMSIAGGTSEIQHNIIGERVLGLPKEPEPYKNAPFRDIPKN